MVRLFLCSILLFIFSFGNSRNFVDTPLLYSLKIKLEVLSDRDQQNRTLINIDKLYEAQFKFGIKSKEYQSVYQLITLYDSLNQQELVLILDKYGWLGKNQVGEKANEAIFFIIQHSNNKLRLKYISLMRASVVKGESDELHLRWLEDRILQDQDMPLKYGTQGYTIQRKDDTREIYTNRKKANEELINEGFDTIPAPLKY